MDASAAVTVLWIMLANGNVVTRDFPSFEACHATQRVLQNYAAAAGDRRFLAMLCIGEVTP